MGRLACQALAPRSGEPPTEKMGVPERNML
jgi:hypothetical protein